MSDTLEHRCALQSTRGTIYDYMSNQEKIYIDIKDLCSRTGGDGGRKHHLVKSGCSVQCENFNMEEGQVQDGKGRGQLKVSNSPLALNVFGDYSHYLPVALNSKISEGFNCKVMQFK